MLAFIMKKILLSTFIILSFGFYVIFQNTNNRANSIAISPTETPIVATNNSKSKDIFSNLISDVTNSNNTTTTTTTTSTKTPIKTPTKTPTPITTTKGQYTDGTYTGNSVDAYYGYVQVKAVVSGGKLTDVVFLDYPHDRNTSKQINAYAMPRLTQQAISAQNANVNGVSGASFTSSGFKDSLASALAKA